MSQTAEQVVEVLNAAKLAGDGAAKVGGSMRGRPGLAAPLLLFAIAPSLTAVDVGRSHYA